MTENEKIITLNGTEYIIKTDNGQTLTSELLTNVKNQLMIKMGITSNPKSNSTIMKLGTPTCPTSPIPLNTVGTLTASVTQGTAPFTYIWTITKPLGGSDNLPNTAGPHNYPFTQTGIYTINLTVVDSCPTGTLSDNASCNVTVAPITGNITFNSTPSGASIYLDGTLVGTTNTTITNVSLDIAHPYTLSLNGYNNYTGSVTLTTASPNQTVTSTLVETSIVYSMSLYGCDSELTLGTNPSCTLTSSCLDQFGSAISCGSITWSSSNSSIATVNSSGTVTAVSQGTVTITATTSNGTVATKSITIEQQTIQEFGMGMATLALAGLFLLSKMVSKK